MVEALAHTNRTLVEDGVHFTRQDYLEVAREINLHLDHYRTRPQQPQRPLLKHDEYLATQAEFEELMGLREMGNLVNVGRAEMAEAEQANIRERVNELVEGARLQEERRSDNGKDGSVEEGILEQDNARDLVDDLAEEERLLEERNEDIWGVAEGTISWADEARLLGEEVPAGGLAEGAMGGIDGTHGEGATQRDQDNFNTQEGDTDKTDMNNNNSGRGQGPRTRAYRRPYGRILGRGGKQKHE